MGIFEGEEERRYEMIRSLVVLSMNSTFLDEGANYVDLLNHSAFNGVSHLVDKGYATRITKRIHDIDETFYRLNDEGRKLLSSILCSIDLD